MPSGTEPIAGSARIATLDLVRGVAVLGILAVNIAGFAKPESATFSPDLPNPGSLADRAAFMVMLVLFEGKMRTLFSMLFGASMILFVERADAAGREGASLQARRLGWLALFGYLHFALLWDGDILFLYAVVGFAALSLREVPNRVSVIAAALVLLVWQLLGLAMWLETVLAEGAVRAGMAASAGHLDAVAFERTIDARDLAEANLGFLPAAARRLTDRPLHLLEGVMYGWGETLPLMLIGMALLRTGFFNGGWSRVALVRIAAIGIVLGGGLSLGFALWSARAGFPEMAMHMAIGFLMAFPHLLMALGYAALIVLMAPRLLASPIGQRIAAAGRMAFSNYLGTSLVMGAVFSGWGLGWFARFSWAEMTGFVLAGWVLMLAWSRPWLAHFRQGPLEWLWRSLTEGRALTFRR